MTKERLTKTDYLALFKVRTAEASRVGRVSSSDEAKFSHGSIGKTLDERMTIYVRLEQLGYVAVNPHGGFVLTDKGNKAIRDHLDAHTTRVL